MPLRQVPQVRDGPEVGLDQRREANPIPELQQEEERPREASTRAVVETSDVIVVVVDVGDAEKELEQVPSRLSERGSQVRFFVVLACH